MAKSDSDSGSPSSKSLLFMMVAMTCGFCVLLGAGLLMASRVIGALGLREGRDKTTVRTPLGEFRVEKAREVGPGLPVYPASTLVLPGGTVDLPTHGDQPQVVSSIYHTNSTREYVANWYGEHLSAEFTRQDNGPKKLPDVFQGSRITEDDVVFVGERGDQVRAVALTLDEAGTKITLLRSTTKAPAQAVTTPPAQ